MSRESDIQVLINEVINIELVDIYDHNKDVTDWLCPFCYEKFKWSPGDINKTPTIMNIEHSKDCAYLIAKDLAT